MRFPINLALQRSNYEEAIQPMIDHQGDQRARGWPVAQMIDSYRLSKRASQISRLQSSVCRYKTHPKYDSKLRVGLKEPAIRHSSYGYLFLHVLLKKKTMVNSRKRTYRICREEGLQVLTKSR